MKFCRLYYCSLFLLIFISSASRAQEYKGIKYAGKNFESKCRKCLDQIASMPQEVNFGVRRDEDWNLYFSISSVEWFDNLFKGGSDGVAVDIVSKDQIVCGGKNKLEESWVRMGSLTQPTYLKEMKQNLEVTDYGHVVVKVGRVPTSLRGKRLEYNMVLIKNKYFCYYQTFYELARYRWDILDMGMYLDSVEFGMEYDTSDAIKSRVSFLDSRMKFVIPFEKGKWDYDPKDIQPFYDSLKLENFDITRIDIRAYASVEGTAEKNEELLEKRAESIIQILQEKQLLAIDKKVRTSENWVEFYEDIGSSRYGDLAEMSKEEVKEKLTDKKILENLEPILQRHRKAVIALDVKRKATTSEEKSNIIKAFQEAIKDENIERAIELQRSIHLKILHHELPDDIINDMEIPRQLEYNLLVNNKAAFNHYLHPEEITETYKEFQELAILFPQDKRFSYNLIALKFKLWLMGIEEVDAEKFEVEIKDLKKLGVASSHVRRMLINFNIVMSEIYQYMGEYENKDNALEYIKKNYRYVEMSNEDLLSLAQYFSSYARYDWATSLLIPHVKKIDVDEDLLFYYINLTIVDRQMLKKSSYKNILLNAIAIDPQRFCRFFDTIEEGGASFQLLLDDNLKDLYCQDCESETL